MFRFLPGYLAGLSVGIYCLGLCLPAFLPVLLGEKRDFKKSALVILEFSLGRLLGYFLFGLLFGWLGQSVHNHFVHTVVSLGNLWMGVVLILYSLGRLDRTFCSLKILNRVRVPFLVGLLTGVNICPPFIASLAYVFNLRSAVGSAFYFLSFFLGTSTYLVPALFFGGVFTKYPVVQRISQLSGVLVGIYFVSRNLVLVF